MSEAQSAEERCGNGHRVDKHDDTDDKSSGGKRDEGDMAGASLHGFIEQHDDGSSIELTTSGHVEQMFDVTRNGFLDAVDDVFRVELMEECADVLRDILRLGGFVLVRHCRRVLMDRKVTEGDDDDDDGFVDA